MIFMIYDHDLYFIRIYFNFDHDLSHYFIDPDPDPFDLFTVWGLALLANPP